MDYKKIYRLLLWVQGIYTLLTALWGIADIDSFIAVTGPKEDIWLVKTISVVLAAIGITMIVHASVKDGNMLPVAVLGLTTSLGLAIIDFYYSGNDTISMVYAIDGGIEVLFFVGWIYVIANLQNRDN